MTCKAGTSKHLHTLLTLRLVHVPSHILSIPRSFLFISSVLLLESHHDFVAAPRNRQKDYYQDSSRDLLSTATSSFSSSSSGHMRAKADGHQGLRVISVPPQGEGQGPELGIDPKIEPSLQSPLEGQQQRKLFNSQSTYENERIDDGGDDQVGG